MPYKPFQFQFEMLIVSMFWGLSQATYHSSLATETISVPTGGHQNEMPSVVESH